jgi:hypothetical protein
MLVYGDLIAAGLEEFAADPVVTLFAGRLYRNTATGNFRYYDGAAWKNVVTDGLSANDVNLLSTTTGASSATVQIPQVTTTERLALVTPVTGRIVYDSTLKSPFIYTGTEWAPAGGGATLKSTITQASHGFVSADVGSQLYLVGTTYTKAIASASNTAEVVGSIESIVDTNNFTLGMAGEVTINTAVSGGSALVAGTVYYLSPTVAGQITATEPSVLGMVSLPVGVAKSTTVLTVNIMRGIVVGGTNALSTLSLANNSVNNVQDLGSYEAASIEGYVSLVGTASQKFYFAAQASKTASGSDWNISHQLSGETPPSGFAITITTAGIVQFALPNIAGFVSASVTYSLNAPSVGATFPLSVSARGVLGDVTGTAVPAGYIGQVIENSSSTVSSIASTPQQVATVTLTSGVWLACAYGQWSGDSTARHMQLYVSTTANSTAGTSGLAGTSVISAGWNGSTGVGSTSLNPVPLYVTTTTVYYLNVSTSSISGLSGQANRLQAVRIA